VSRLFASAALRKRERSFGWIALLGVWTFVGLLGGTQRYLQGNELESGASYAWWRAVESNLVLAYLWAVLTPLTMRIARRFSIDRTPVLRLIPIHLLAAAGIALLHTALSNVIYKLALAPDVTWSALIENFARSAVITGPTRVATYLEIVGVTWSLDYYRTYQEREIRNSNLQTQLAEARLEALKLQLQPAFVFDTLNAVLPLIYRDPPAAARTVVQLGGLLRLSLKNGATGLVTLKEELAFLELYLQIERTRLQDRLSVSFSIEPEALSAAVPNLLLQPLVEGAIAQGVSAHAGSGTIEVRAFRREKMLVLEVSETGTQRRTGLGPFHGEDSGLPRTLRRLEHLYPGEHRCERSRLWAEGPGAGHKVTVAIPFASLPEKEKRPAREGPGSPSNALTVGETVTG